MRWCSHSMMDDSLWWVAIVKLHWVECSNGPIFWRCILNKKLQWYQRVGTGCNPLETAPSDTLLKNRSLITFIRSVQAYEILLNGVFHSLARYRQFFALYQELQKGGFRIACEFPAKAILPLSPEGILVRRQGLQDFLQASEFGTFGIFSTNLFFW